MEELARQKQDKGEQLDEEGKQKIIKVKKHQRQQGIQGRRRKMKIKSEIVIRKKEKTEKEIREEKTGKKKGPRI